MKNVTELSKSSIQDIKNIVSEYTQVDPSDFSHKNEDGTLCRERPYSLSRQLLITLLYRNTKCTLLDLGHIAYDKKPSVTSGAVLSAIRTINKYLANKSKPLFYSPILAMVFDEMDKKVAYIISQSELQDKYESIYEEIDSRIKFHEEEAHRYKTIKTSISGRVGYFRFSDWYHELSEELEANGFRGPIYVPSFKDAWLNGQNPRDFADHYIRSRGMKITQ